MSVASPLPVDTDALRTQQQQLRGQGRLHWFHWAIVAGSILITAFAWHYSRSLLDERTAQRFEREATEAVTLVQERLQHYEDALLSSVAAIRASDRDMTRDQWRRYAEQLRLPERYPGISGIGIIRHTDSIGLAPLIERMREDKPDFTVHPEHPFESHLPIVYIEPEAPNAAAIGLDVAFERNRREAALAALSLGTTQVSGPIELVQDAGHTPGFLIYAPYFHEPDEARFTPQDGFATVVPNFDGFVYAPLVVKNLIEGVLDPARRDVSLSIRDGDSVLYEEVDSSDAHGEALRFARTVEVYGRQWHFDVVPAAEFGGPGSHQPLFVLLCGLLIDGLLLLLFYLMVRSNRRLLGLAECVIDGLSRQSTSLHEANDKLNGFAHVASHDLKTPLRNVGDLVSFVEEDLEDYFLSEQANPEVRENLAAVHRYANKGIVLIDGILQYSLAGDGERVQAVIDSRALVREIIDATGLAPDRFDLQGDFPAFRTDAVRLRQVLSNLIGNAVKYHDDPANARIRVAVSRRGDRYHFEVEDDGPGIEPQYHQRIFEAFATLGTRDDVDSTGIGLAIVQKAMASVGGAVSVVSEPGRGSTFHVDWPVTVVDDPPLAA